MPAPEITPLPPAPLRSQSPSTFTATAEAFVDALEDLPGEINALAEYLEGATGSAGPITATQLTMATARLLGRLTTSSGAIEELTAAQVTAFLDAFTSTLKGLVPASGGGTMNFLRADGSWAAPASSGYSPGGTDVALADGGTGASTASGARTNLAAAAQTQTTEQISGFIAAPSNKDYRIVLDMKHAGTITEVTTRSASGTCTATFKINTTALGGTANSVSSTESTQSHSSANTIAAGDDIVLTISSNSSCADMAFTIKYTRTLA